MLKKTIGGNFFARICILFSFIISVLTVPTPTFAAAPCVLTYSMTPKTASVTSGGTITYTITVKNIGNGICRNVSYSLFYAPNEIFVSSIPAPRASNYYWYVGNLNAKKGASTVVTTRNNPAVDGTSVDSEGCATGSNAVDACGSSSVAITKAVAVIVPAPVATTTVPVIPIPASTTTVPTSAPPVSTTTTVVSPVPPVSTVTQPIVPKGHEQGMWVWNFPSQMNTTTGANQLQTIASQGFNIVYITIDDYLDIASLPDGGTKNTQKVAYFLNLNKFIQKANSLGIAVDAEGGWRDWAYTANRWKGFALIDMAKEYNALYPNAKLHGFQYDVEPYLLPEYEMNKATVLTDYVAFIDQSAARLVGSDLQFSISIPHFYDDAQAWTPEITYGGLTAYTFNQLLKVLEQKPGSEILLMSYRNTFAGTDGTQAISQVEIQEATAGHYSTQIIVGQETGNVDPAYVTFYGSTKAVLLKMLGTISSAYGTYANYGGTAVDYLDPYLALQ